MYIGRDMTELTMLLRNEWKEDKITFFQNILYKGYRLCVALSLF